MKDTCTNCEKLMVAGIFTLKRNIAGHLFLCEVPGWRCSNCSHQEFDSRVIQTLELRIAERLLESKDVAGKAFAFSRGVLGLRAVDLANLIDVTAETVSRWENGKGTPDRTVLALLIAEIRKQLGSQFNAFETLKDISKARKLPKNVTLNFPHSKTAA